MDLRDGTLKRFLLKTGAGLVAELLWNYLHLLVTIWYLVKDTVNIIESYFIAHGFLKKYKSLDVSKVRYLAIVVESEEARQITDVIELLHWVAKIGEKHVCLYDMEGVLKDSKEFITSKCNARQWKGVETVGAQQEPGQLTLEFASVADGKEGVVRAANLLFLRYQADQEKSKFTEPLLSEALQLVGCSGPEPDLLVVYGPTRCHLGFPAWRLPYTEILHMGCLKSKKFGSLIKAIYRFTTVRQNYGKALHFVFVLNFTMFHFSLYSLRVDSLCLSSVCAFASLFWVIELNRNQMHIPISELVHTRSRILPNLSSFSTGK